MPPVAPVWEAKAMVQERVRQQGRKELLEGGKKDKDRAGSLAEGVLWERHCASQPQCPSLLMFLTAWLCKRCGVFPPLAAVGQLRTFPGIPYALLPGSLVPLLFCSLPVLPGPLGGFVFLSVLCPAEGKHGHRKHLLWFCL